MDHYQDLRSEMVETLIQGGLEIECHHHEVATAGQCEIDQKYNTLVKSADNMMLYKYIVKNVAYQHGKSVTFMPKPIFGDNGRGCTRTSRSGRRVSRCLPATATRA